MATALEEDEEGDTIMWYPEPQPAELEEEQKEPDKETERTVITNEYINVRAIHGSKQYINDATAAGHKPSLYLLTETWWETGIHPKMDEYTLITHKLGTRKYATGRAKGGIAVYNHKDCLAPTRPRTIKENLTDAIALEIGETADGKGKIAILAYYLAATTISATKKYFDMITDELNKMEAEGFRTFLLGDSNGDRDNSGEPRNDSAAGSLLQQAERNAKHKWLCPTNDGPCYTHYNISKEMKSKRRDFDPATATAAIDHTSAGPNSVLSNTVVSYRLNEEFHLGTDHVGLLLQLQYDQHKEDTLCKQKAEPKNIN
jgi:hypothetical protein